MQKPHSLYITAIPIFTTNYVWAIINSLANEAYIVDPGDATPVLEFLDAQQLQLKAILVTHSHADHCNGIDELLNQYGTPPVYGPQCQAIGAITHPVDEGDSIELWPGCNADVFHLPGHMPEHMAYLLQSPQLAAPALMCGDILFSSGCGRMFSGPAEVYNASLERVAALAADTQLYCAHEYTLDNIRFAKYLEPNNAYLDEKQQRTEQALATDGRSLPTTVAIELKSNPFLRCDSTELRETIRQLTGQTPCTSADWFAAVRTLKDQF